MTSQIPASYEGFGMALASFSSHVGGNLIGAAAGQSIGRAIGAFLGNRFFPGAGKIIGATLGGSLGGTLFSGTSEYLAQRCVDRSPSIRWGQVVSTGLISGIGFGAASLSTLAGKASLRLTIDRRWIRAAEWIHACSRGQSGILHRSLFNLGQGTFFRLGGALLDGEGLFTLIDPAQLAFDLIGGEVMHQVGRRTVGKLANSHEARSLITKSGSVGIIEQERMVRQAMLIAPEERGILKERARRSLQDANRLSGEDSSWTSWALDMALEIGLRTRRILQAAQESLKKQGVVDPEIDTLIRETFCVEGEAWLLKGRWDDAMRSFLAADHSYGDAKTIFGRARAAWDAKNPDKALADLRYAKQLAEQVAREDPRRGGGLFWSITVSLGQLLNRLHKHREAADEAFRDLVTHCRRFQQPEAAMVVSVGELLSLQAAHETDRAATVLHDLLEELAKTRDLATARRQVVELFRYKPPSFGFQGHDLDEQLDWLGSSFTLLGDIQGNAMVLEMQGDHFLIARDRSQALVRYRAALGLCTESGDSDGISRLTALMTVSSAPSNIQ